MVACCCGELVAKPAIFKRSCSLDACILLKTGFLNSMINQDYKIYLYRHIIFLIFASYIVIYEVFYILPILILNEKENIGRYKELFLTYGFLTIKRSKQFPALPEKSVCEKQDNRDCLEISFLLLNKELKLAQRTNLIIKL